MIHWCFFLITKNTFCQMIVDFLEYKICICFWLLSQCYCLNYYSSSKLCPVHIRHRNHWAETKGLPSSSISRRSKIKSSDSLLHVVIRIRLLCASPSVTKVTNALITLIIDLDFNQTILLWDAWLFAEQVNIFNDADSIASLSRIITMFFAIILSILKQNHQLLYLSVL